MAELPRSEGRRFVPLGGTDPVSVDVRIVSATHQALRKEVEEKRFREDLMYRLRVVVLYLPLMSVPMSLPFIATNWHMPTWGEWLLLIGIGIATQLAHGRYPSSDLYHRPNTSQAIADALASAPLYTQKRFYE